MRIFLSLFLSLAAMGLPRAHASPATAYPHLPPPYTCVTNYYVDGTVGSDSNQGASPQSAWRTIRRAVIEFAGYGHGGICVNVAPGTYSELLYLGLMGGSSDSETGYLVFRSAVPLKAKITLPRSRWAKFHNIGIQFSSYIIFDGFEEYFENSAAAPNAGFFIQGKPDNITHHIKILNCLIHDTGSSGIAIANHTDYITASGNTIHNTAGYINGSPLTMWRAYAFDTKPGYHNFFTNNKIYNNINFGDFEHTEGTGIIMDQLDHYSYPNATLIENNVIFGNGGSCIAIYQSSNATVRFNTCYHNTQDPSITFARGEIFAAQANNTVLANNIAYAAPGPPPGVTALDDDPGPHHETGNRWVSNLAYGIESDGVTPLKPESLIRVAPGGAPITAGNGNLLGADPLFKNAPRDFSLMPGSPAIGAADEAWGVPAQDIRNKPRKAPHDLGAFAFSP